MSSLFMDNFLTSQRSRPPLNVSWTRANSCGQSGVDLYCHRNATNGQVTRDTTIPEAIQALDLNSRRALMGWLNKIWSFLGRRTGTWRGPITWTVSSTRAEL